MSTFQQRYLNTKKVILHESVTVGEAYMHLYYFLRFEHAIAQAKKANRIAAKYNAKMNVNLEVFQLRMEMVDL